jgi:hypothetical protein
MWSAYDHAERDEEALDEAARPAPSALATNWIARETTMLAANTGDLPWEKLIPLAHPHEHSHHVRCLVRSVQGGTAACVACTNSSAVEHAEDRT